MKNSRFLSGLMLWGCDHGCFSIVYSLCFIYFFYDFPHFGPAFSLDYVTVCYGNNKNEYILERK